MIELTKRSTNERRPMPYQTIGDLRLHYQTTGDPAAPPLLIIPGLTDTTAKCEWQLPDLSEDFYIITFDNRSAGLSDDPGAGYTMRDLAGDAVGLLDGLRIQTTNVFGFSMGGMIALNLALDYPDRVRRLVVGCTSAGGRLAVPPQPEIIDSLTNPVSSGDRYQDFLSGMWVSLSESFCNDEPETVRLLADQAAKNPQTAAGYAAQLQAIMTHDVADRLSELRMPVLVMHGLGDRLMPAENSRLLAESIPGARLILYPQAGHMFFVEQSARVNQDIRTFLLENGR